MGPLSKMKWEFKTINHSLRQHTHIAFNQGLRPI